ncbi:MAG: prephenate dehydratase [Deltaproteobacteria bacterium]|nr:prephenate dehydratase [Deltaproteobacteria bacterium]
MSSEDLEAIRRQVDTLDEDILDRINRRLKLMGAIAEIKNDADIPVHDPGREKEIIVRLSRLNKGPLPEDVLKLIFGEIISAARALQKRLRVTYLGPQMTFTHMAAMSHFGSSVDMEPLSSLDDIFREVERGTYDQGVVPVENTTEGIVSHTLDLFLDTPLVIRAEILMDITFDLLSRSGRREDIRKIISHPQALAQCRGFLNRSFAGTPRSEAPSTAAAAQAAADDPSIAAIASRAAGIHYGLMVVEEHIQDNRINMTRFFVLGRKETARVDHAKTSLIFSVRHAPGTLYNALKSFADRGVNLTKIESRPIRGQPWEYFFFLDLEGHREDDPVARAIEDLRPHCSFVKILGSFPRG